MTIKWVHVFGMASSGYRDAGIGYPAVVEYMIRRPHGTQKYSVSRGTSESAIVAGPFESFQAAEAAYMLIVDGGWEVNCKSQSIEAEIDRLWGRYFAAVAPLNEAECVEKHNKYMAGGQHDHDIWEKYHSVRQPLLDDTLTKISALSARAEFKVIQ